MEIDTCIKPKTSVDDQKQVDSLLQTAPVMQFSDRWFWEQKGDHVGVTSQAYGTVRAFAERWARLMQLAAVQDGTITECWDRVPKRIDPGCKFRCATRFRGGHLPECERQRRESARQQYADLRNENKRLIEACADALFEAASEKTDYWMFRKACFLLSKTWVHGEQLSILSSAIGAEVERRVDATA